MAKSAKIQWILRGNVCSGVFVSEQVGSVSDYGHKISGLKSMASLVALT